jgi:hypothetical protein
MRFIRGIHRIYCISHPLDIASVAKIAECQGDLKRLGFSTQINPYHHESITGVRTERQRP